MASWETFRSEAPALADLVRGRFEAHGLALLATLRADGAPRISGIEVFFGGGELWMGMMHGSRKALDLLRDPRLALHSATTDKDVAQGDAKIGGRAIEATDADSRRAFVAAVRDESGDGPPEPFHAFRVDVDLASILLPAGDHLDIRWWREGEGESQVDRR